MGIDWWELESRRELAECVAAMVREEVAKIEMHMLGRWRKDVVRCVAFPRPPSFPGVKMHVFVEVTNHVGHGGTSSTY